jgi:hypothetical protein
MNAITPIENTSPAITDLSQALADFLRLNVTDGDTSPKTVTSYLIKAKQYTQWCEAEGIGDSMMLLCSGVYG